MAFSCVFGNAEALTQTLDTCVNPGFPWAPSMIIADVERGSGFSEVRGTFKGVTGMAIFRGYRVSCLGFRV